MKAVICDGPFANQSTTACLSRRFEIKEMKTFFMDEESGKPVYFMFDACGELFQRVGLYKKKNKKGEDINNGNMSKNFTTCKATTTVPW